MSDPTPRAVPRKRLLRALGGVAKGAGVLFTFVVALVAAVVLHIGSAPARRIAVTAVNGILAPQFKGKITLQQVGALGLRGVGGVDARIQAPDGSDVIVAKGARVRIAPVALIRSFTKGQGELRVDVFDVVVQSVEVNVAADSKGDLTLSTAFEPAKPSPPPSPDARPFHLELPDIVVEDTVVHERMPSAPPVDAELIAFHGSVRVAPKDMAFDVAQVTLVTHGAPQKADARGLVAAHIALPSKTGQALGLKASFDGAVGDIPATVRAEMDGDRVDAVLDVPKVAADAIRGMVPQAPLYQPVSAHVEAHGPLARLQANVHVGVGAGKLDASGVVAAAGPLAANLKIGVEHIDIRAFSPTGPASDLSLDAEVHADSARDKQLEGSYTIDVHPGQAAGQVVPRTTLHGEFTQKAAAKGQPAGFEVTAKGTVYEAGAPTDVDVVFYTNAKAPVANVHVRSRVDRLSALTRVGGLGPGKALVQIDGAVTLGTPPTFDATVRADVADLQQGDSRVDQALVEARASGPFADPTIDASIKARGITAAGRTLRQLHATTRGSLSQQSVTAWTRGEGVPDARVKASIGIGGAITVDGAAVDLSRHGATLHAQVDHLRVASGHIDVVGAEITGVGAPTHGTLHKSPGSLTVQGESKGLDLKKLGDLLGLEHDIRKGTLAFAIDVAAHPDSATGTATIDVDDGCAYGVDGLKTHVQTQLDGRRITGTIQAAVAGVGNLDVDKLRVEVGGTGPLVNANWQKATGSVSFDGQVDLAKAADLLPASALPFAKIAGQVTLQGRVARNADSDFRPDLTLGLKTAGLAITPKRGTGEPVTGKPPTLVTMQTPVWSGIDAQVDARVAGGSGFAEAAFRLVDKMGSLVAFDAKTNDVPYDALLAKSDTSILERLKDVPFVARVLVPQRALDELPDIVRPNGTHGEVEGTLLVTGTLAKPTVKLTASAQELSLEEASSHLKPLDVELGGGYDGEAGTVSVDVRSRDKELLRTDARATFKVADIIAGKTPDWGASAKGTLARFPLDAIPQVADRQIRGILSGDFEVKDIHKDARLRVDLKTDDMRVGKAKLDSGTIHVGYDGKQAEAKVRLAQAATFIDVDASLPMTWGANPAPDYDPSRATHATIKANHFSASFLAPFVESALDSIDGTIDADAQIALEPNQKPSMTGSVSLRDATMDVDALGEELHGVNASVVFAKDGTVRVDGLTAYATTGKITAKASAQLDGTQLKGAEAAITIERRDAMPLAVQGAQLGNVYGRIDVKVTATPETHAMAMKIDIPNFHVELPEQSTHSVQDLDEPPTHVRVGTYASADRFVMLPLDGSTIAQDQQAAAAASSTTIAVHLGEIDVSRGTDLAATLSGDLTIKNGAKTEINGVIHLQHGGHLDVQGKDFDIESGTVTFVGDPGNPLIAATASWAAGDGITKVYADYAGPLKTGKVRLRSEPPRSNDEILALLLFGSDTGSSDSPYQSPSAGAEAQAGAAAGGYATQGLTKGLNKLTGLQVSAKIDTGATTTKPEVSVQISRDISVQLAVILGTPPPGTNSDSTLITVDWRFFRSWSLETTVGNAGSTIGDVVWQHRY